VTYTFKLSKRMSIIWRSATWIPFLVALTLLATLPPLSYRINLSVLWLSVAKLLAGKVRINRLVLSHGNGRTRTRRVYGGRRISDHHPAWELSAPSGGAIWLFVFVGFTRVFSSC
jgi:hypothetical protein